MATRIDDITNGPTLTRLWEAVRTLASIVTACALLVLVAGSSMFGSPDPSVQAGRPVSIRPQLPTPSPTKPSEPPQLVTAVFYLVRTPEQAYLADLGAWDNYPDASYRHYDVLHARDDEEFRLAGEYILDHILVHGASSSVQVIDLRDVKTDLGD